MTLIYLFHSFFKFTIKTLNLKLPLASYYLTLYISFLFLSTKRNPYYLPLQFRTLILDQNKYIFYLHFWFRFDNRSIIKFYMLNNIFPF